MTKRFGFTLAEVLITLGIIGVVAAMTMPTLINQTNGAQFRAAFKKELSVMAQAAALNQALDDWDFSELTGADGGKLSELIDARINVISSSTTAPTDYNPTLADGDGDIDGITFKAPTTKTYAIFNDGSMFIFDDAAKDCTKDTPCFGYFDVNGPKNPNKLTACDGKTSGDDCYVKDGISDIFPVYYYGQTILPASDAGNAVLSDKTKANNSTTTTGSSGSSSSSSDDGPGGA